MVDIETLDTEETAVILSIGACLVPRTTCQFYVECEQGLGQLNRTISQSTLDWWNTQPVGLKPNGHDLLIDSLTWFSHWLTQLPGKPIIWAKGIDFETKILANAYKMYGLPVPWKYNDVRDFRTLKKVFISVLGDSIPENAQPHNALADAKHQADVLEMIIRNSPSLILS
jgi:hypothetical protein